MAMSPQRWISIAESQFPWERDALEWLRARLPDRDPWHAWANFEFIDDDGKVNEVDALILTPSGLFLIEIKSRPGVVDGDAHTWTWNTDGKAYSYDNPLLLANRKAKRLASVLKKQPSVTKAKVKLPFVEPVIFLSATSLTCKLSGPAASRVYLRGQPGAEEDSGIVALLFDGLSGQASGASRVDHHQSRTLARAMVDAGVRPSNKHRRVGEYELGALIGEGENFQDWEGRHVSIESIRRRIRIYTYATAATEQARKTLVRQAAREFQILEGIDHPGILKVREYKDTELGPALVFDHDPRSIRLDFLLREQGGRLNVEQRLHIVRQLAETLKYAHQKKLYHRALCPQNLLVRDPSSRLPVLQIMNWQTGTRESSTGGTGVRTVGTLHVEEYVEDLGRIYLAPESSAGDLPHGPHVDVFSLGAIAYHVFAGQPPAASLVEMHDRLRAGPGLRISDVLDGAGRNLQDLIQFSTIPDVSARFTTVDDFLKALDEVEDEITAPDPEKTIDPSVATAGERIDSGFTVVRRLGKGSSSDVLLVKADGSDEELVLKVASDPAHNDRLIAEGDLLAKLQHQCIVGWKRTVTVAGRTAILMKKAGESTLAQRLREGLRLSLDLLQRFGEELIQTVDYLEQQGIAHRDIKPENIGMSQVGAKGKLQLVVFDFSLSRTSPDNVSAGTHPYLDPFLSLRRPPRWDLYAERFALAVTLYEMVTGDLPKWGDGKTAPAMLDCEVTLDSERFDLHLRDGLTSFFGRALARDYRDRFDNAEEMLRAWRRVFEEAQPGGAQPDAFDDIANQATSTTTIAELGYSVEAQNVLEGMGIHNVKELLAVDRIRFRYLKGVGDRIRKEIRLKAKGLAYVRPDLAQGRPTIHGSEDGALGADTVDELAAQLLPKRPAGDDRPEDRALAVYLGLEELEGDHLWPTLGNAATQCQLARSAVSAALLKARERWLKSPSITEMRNELQALLESHGGVATVEEAANGLLAARGSAQQDDELRLRLAAAVVRACLEAESDLAGQRFQVFENDPMPLLAINAELADYAKRLAKAADDIAAAEVLWAPQRVIEALDAVPRPEMAQPLPAQRMLRLATGASKKAALSSRLEIYPRGMPALQAIRQSIGALVGPRHLTEEQLIERVHGRYPQAESLPKHPVLDELLGAAGATLDWQESGPSGPGYYQPVKGPGTSAGTTTYFARYSTHSETAVELTSDVAEARQFEDRVAYAAKAGGFLALTVSPRLARHAEAELLRRFDLERLSLDALLVSAMRNQAAAVNADWDVVLRADGAAPGSRDWTNLTRLVQKTVPSVRQHIAAQPKTVLLVNAGLLGRYQLMGLLEDLRDQAGRPASLPGLWLLVPMSASGLPTIDGVSVPLTSGAQWARIPQAWIENAHRAGTGVTGAVA